MPEFDAPIQPQAGGGDVGKLSVGAGFMSNLGKMQSGADNMLKVGAAEGNCDSGLGRRGGGVAHDGFVFDGGQAA
ncbi:hypothetical protein LY13_005085, partial [Prauserella aidingensis]|uniref:hypothetical protein n=1 Tax=Prauserella aidingensis TaxID=387890 RepID=UPI0020A251A7